YMPNTGFTITGTIADTYKLGNLKLIEKLDNEDPAEHTLITFDTPDTSYNFSRTVPYSGTVPEGEHTFTYEFVVTDAVGHTVSSKSFTTRVDTAGPTVTVTNPQADTGDNAKKGTNAIAETTYRFTGNSTDANGVSAVWYKIATTQPSAASVPSLTSETESLRATLTDATWTDAGFTKATSTTPWNSYVTFKTKGATGEGYEEGLNYNIYVYAVDQAGNVSASPAVRNFDVDMTEPSLTVGAITNTANDTTPHCLEKNTIYYFNGANLTGTLSYSDTL
ncbi:MAG: hypothetical protein IKN54_05845, partial [Lachnospiraceae bacterium]|nr:hypothetical protein [Lachnospiraceae bacterium]